MSGDETQAHGPAQDDRTDTTDTTVAADEMDTTDDEQEITLTFSYDPQATLDELFGISEDTLFQAFDLALAHVGVTESVEVSVLITTDEGIRALNRDYRGKDEPTDVLSFPLLDQPLVEAPADQLWQEPDTETEEGDEPAHSFYPGAEADDTDEDFTDEEESGDQSLKGKIVLMGDEGAGDDEFTDEVEVWPTHLGDIAISRETTLRQAQQAGHSAAYEVAFLFVHGVLHLVGFDDHTDAGYQAMVAHQEAVLAQAGVTR